MAGLAKIFGERLRALRNASGLSQAELADRVELSEEWIRRMERGEGSPSLQTIETLASVLGADPVELLSSEPVEAPPEQFAAAVRGLDEASIAWLIKGARLLRRT